MFFSPFKNTKLTHIKHYTIMSFLHQKQVRMRISLVFPELIVAIEKIKYTFLSTNIAP